MNWASSPNPIQSGSVNVLRLKTLGGLSLEGTPGDTAGRTAQRRRLALLALLAAHRNRAVSREKLVSYFWPERSAEEARHSLAQLLYAVRQELGDEVIVSGADDVRINPAVLASDVAEFETAFDRGDFEAAAALYAGPFLDGFYLNDAPEFERWSEQERAHLAGRGETALENLARAAQREGSPAKALEWWRRRAALDPLNARAAVELMNALAAVGNKAGAIRHAAVHETLMRSDLDAPADPEVAALAERLRHELTAVGGFPPREAAGPDQADSAEPEPLSAPGPRLRLVWPVLAALVLLAVLGAAALRARRLRSLSPGGPTLIVLGAIEGPDSNLTLAVREALRSDLESEPSLRVMGETRLRETLRLMDRPADTPLRGPVAAEVALRRGASFAVVGTVVPVGTSIEIVGRTLDPKTGEALLTVSEHPTVADAVSAIARIGERLRRRAVGSARAPRPAALPPVMTSSLAALQDYALARQALARFDRGSAMRFAQAALEQDSLFPMAHYIVGDLAWFSDHQHECEVHLGRALALRDRLPLRERLVVQARYQQLVADQSDSAMAYWERLHAVFPDDGQAFEGMAWTYRAMGRYREAAAAADSALQADSTTFAPSATNELYALLEAGDTAAALRFARAQPERFRWMEWQTRFETALAAKDWRRALNPFPEPPLQAANQPGAIILPDQHIGLLVNGRLADAARLIPTIEGSWPTHQFTPRAILAQARAELIHAGSPSSASAAARKVLAWIEAGDLSAPAIARLTERTVELAARARDPVTIAAARHLIERRDRGRNLPSYRLALLTVDAAAAFVRGEMKSAAHFAEAARQGMFHGRSLALTALLEADARAARGQTDAARALYRQLLTPDAFAAGDIETWAILEPAAERGLERLTHAKGL